MATAIAQVSVFNGFSDFSTTFDGKRYSFPEGRVTPLSEHYSATADEYMREHESNPTPDAMLEKTYTPQQLVELLFTRDGDNLVADGCVWIGDGEPSKAERDDAILNGRLRKIRLVEEAQAARNQALAKGGQPQLDKQIVRWMRELAIHDPLYNPIQKDAANDSIERLASVILSAQQKPTEPAGARK